MPNSTTVICLDRNYRTHCPYFCHCSFRLVFRACLVVCVCVHKNIYVWVCVCLHDAIHYKCDDISYKCDGRASQHGHMQGMCTICTVAVFWSVVNMCGLVWFCV